MFIVTFEENHGYYSAEKWIESSRVFDGIDETREFVEFLYNECCIDDIRNVRIWKASPIKFSIDTKVVISQMVQEGGRVVA